MRVLLVEDNAGLRSMISGHLRDRGFAVDPAETGEQALASASAATYSAMILDLGLPDMDGLDLLRALRAGSRSTDLPTLILTARDSVEQRISGLDAGADDYILKPFDLMELEARLRAVLRRPGPRLQPVYTFADLSFDTASRAAQCRKTPIDLTPREATLFEELMRSGSRIVVRDTLAERLYGFEEDVTANALEATVSRLRRKLTSSGSEVRIETLRGIGYRLAG
jgi:DNA-binding response OmpR family regulator